MVTCRGVFAHVPVAGFYPGGVVHDPVHDGVGVGAATEPLVPVLLGVLGGEQGAAGVVAAFHELEQERAEALLGRVEQPSVEREDRVRAVSFEQFRASLGLVGGLSPFLLEVRDADVACPVPVAARLSGQGADDPAFAGPAVALGYVCSIESGPCERMERFQFPVVPRLGDNRLGCGVNGLIMSDGSSDRGIT